MSRLESVLDQRIRLWLDDPESTVEYSEVLEGRIAVRMRQETREATTVWFEVGERSITVEAYVMPGPGGAAPLHLKALRRNMRAWRVFFAVDDEGGLVLRGRLPAEQVTLVELDLVLGEIYETIEVAFRPLLRSAKFPLRNL